MSDADGQQPVVEVCGIPIGNGSPLVLIGGPCVIESREILLRTAEALVGVAGDVGLPLIFKSSYEKDNRTSASAFRGPGIDEGLRLLAEIKQRFAVPVLSDVHRVEDVLAAAEVLDVVQVPALLCRQTSLLEAVGRCGRAVNLKKGQFLAPAAMGGAVAKVTDQGADQVLLTERGSFFGYDHIVCDLPAIDVLRQHGCPVVFDAGHPANRAADIPLLARCGAAAGADALYLECHLDPSAALCDGDRMVALDQLPALLRVARQIAELVRRACPVATHGS